MEYTETFGYQWNIHAKTQLDSYLGRDISRRRLFSGTKWPEKMPGQRILEAGSGAGRFTEILCSTGAEIWSFDDSCAVDANRANNGHNQNLHLFRANIYDIDFREPFDKVMCFGVLQHTPDPRRAFLNLAKQLKPGGEIAIDIYAFRLTGLLHWKYALRPITKRMDKELLYGVVSRAAPFLLPIAIFMRRLAGKVGARLVPVCEYTDLGLPYQQHLDWSILDTFDALSPWYDKPQTMRTIRGWFEEAGLVGVSVKRGFNGIVARGRKP